MLFKGNSRSLKVQGTHVVLLKSHLKVETSLKRLFIDLFILTTDHWSIKIRKRNNGTRKTHLKYWFWTPLWYKLVNFPGCTSPLPCSSWDTLQQQHSWPCTDQGNKTSINAEIFFFRYIKCLLFKSQKNNQKVDSSWINNYKELLVCSEQHFLSPPE